MTTLTRLHDDYIKNDDKEVTTYIISILIRKGKEKPPMKMKFVTNLQI